MLNTVILSGFGMLWLLGLVAFLGVILILVSMLMYARKKLVPSGPVKITINNEQVIETSAGSSLLSTLSNNKVYLPSACGGGGTCGMCKCQVEDGGGSIPPTETGFFTRKQQKDNWRLGCQVKVRTDMHIKVPEEILGIKKWECTVVSNRNVATFIKEFVVKLPEGETLNFKSGNYIQIDVPKCEVDFSSDVKVESQFKDEWDKFGIWNLKFLD